MIHCGRAVVWSKYHRNMHGFVLLLGSSGGMAIRVSLLIYFLVVEMVLLLKFSDEIFVLLSFLCIFEVMIHYS